MEMKALYLNCSLKRSPEPSHTSALMRTSRDILESEGVTTEEIRIADLDIPAIMEEDAGAGDEWPGVFRKVLDSRILVMGAPIWLGEKSSLCAKVIERLYASSGRRNDRGQWIYYNHVAGAIITGNEDGGKESARSILYALQHIGFTVPPNADAYWVGEAGPGPSYMGAGRDNAWTKRNIRILSYNLIHFAHMFEDRPIPSKGNSLEQ